MKLRTLSVMTLLLGALVVAKAASAADRPNILFIAIDDLRNDLGCYGVDEVRSPNIDNLARSGVVFDRAYCQVAVCNPSRASLMTGLRPDTVRVWNLRVHFREMMPDVVTLPQHLRRHGYHAVGMGKIYHNPFPDPQSWSEPIRSPRNLVFYGPEVRQEIRDAQAKMPKSDWRKTDLRGPATYAQQCVDDRTYDGAIAGLALDAMDRMKDQDAPFFLAVGFIRPHLPRASASNNVGE